MSINTKKESESNSKSIYEIIQAGDIAGVRDFIASGADINQVDKNSGWTPLEMAAEKGKLEIAKILIEAGAIVDNGLSEPLDLAAYNGFTEIVNLLLQAGHYADKEKNKRFYDAFFSAIICGHIEIVKAFIRIGTDVNYLLNGDSGLCRATESCHQEIVEFLLEVGAEVNLRDGNQSTPLIQAAYRASGEIARILIAAGADINAKDDNGYTALMLAAKSANAEVAGELILAGADLDSKDKNGNTALMYASINQHGDITEPIPDLEELEQISSEGANSLEDKFKKLEQLGNILSNIEITGRVNIAKMLRVAGASQQGLSVNDLIKAAETGNFLKVQNLINAGVDINGFSPTGHTALLQAVRENHINIVTTLIEAGADINLQGNIDHTPLMEAAMREHTEIVRILIEAGADVNIHTDYECTAFMRAQESGNSEIIKLLKDAGARNYHEIPVSEWRGIDTIDLNDRCVIVNAPIEEVSQALYQIRNANIWQKDVFEKEIEMTDICFIVFQFTGHSWTAIRDQNITVSYDYKNFDSETFRKQWQNQINEQNAKNISKLLKTKAIDFGCSDTSGAVGYSVFDSGELVEEFDYCCDSDLINEDEKPAEENECVIVTNTFNFRSKLRHINIDEIPQNEPDDEDYFVEEPDLDIDEFKFVNDFLKSLDAYIPAWRGGRFYKAGQRITLRVIGFDPEDIERMDFIAIS